MDLYFRWLLNLIDCPEEYTTLMEKLHSRDFHSPVPMDINRIEDGLALRSMFVDESGFQDGEEDLLRKPCSVLEMMVALACRMEDDIMADADMGDRAPLWFWTMISNLGLDGMDNDHFDNENVDHVLNVLINRTYFMNGSGGLFPLKIPKMNQRRVEIWYQMNQWLSENTK